MTLDISKLTEAEQQALAAELQTCPGKQPPATLVLRQMERAAQTLIGKQIGLLFQFTVYAFNCPEKEKIQHFHADALDLLANNLTPEQITSVIAALEHKLGELKQRQS